jgi:GDPmannose 4,6-dehydratase
MPELTMEINGIRPLKLFESVRLCLASQVKVYHASTSDMFGKSENGSQNENTPFAPTLPYGSAKLMAHPTAINYREAYGMFISCGILFNHESPRRGEGVMKHKI